MKAPSNKQLLDAFVNAIQDFDGYFGRTGRTDTEFKRREMAYKAVRKAVRLRMMKVKELKG